MCPTLSLTVFPEGTRDGSLHIVRYSDKGERLRHLRSFAFPKTAKHSAQCHPWLVACSFSGEALSPSDTATWILASFRGEVAAWKVDFDAQLTREDAHPISNAFVQRTPASPRCCEDRFRHPSSAVPSSYRLLA